MSLQSATFGRVWTVTRTVGGCRRAVVRSQALKYEQRSDRLHSWPGQRNVFVWRVRVQRLVELRIDNGVRVVDVNEPWGLIIGHS